MQDYNQSDREANTPRIPGHNLSKEQFTTQLQQQEAYIKWMQEMYRTLVGSFIFMLANGPFSWKTALDRKIAVHAARDTIIEAIWLSKLFEELNIPNIGSKSKFQIKIHEDSLSTIMCSKSPAHHTTIKHL